MRVLKPNGKILFKEEQSFRQTWIWVLLIFSFTVPLVLIVVLVSHGKTSTTGQPMIAFFAVLASGIINGALFCAARLETIVTDEGVFYRWMPFVKKFAVIRWPELKEVIVKRYPYLQYGYHITFRYGKVHNVNGNLGVQFVLLNGRKIYLGSQRIAAFEHALNTVMPQLVQSEINNID